MFYYELLFIIGTKGQKYPKFTFFIILKGSLSFYFTKHIFGVFHYFSHHGQAAFFFVSLLLSVQYLNLIISHQDQAAIFFYTLTSLSLIFEPYNKVCVLGAINVRYEALCSDIRLFILFRVLK